MMRKTPLLGFMGLALLSLFATLFWIPNTKAVQTEDTLINLPFVIKPAPPCLPNPPIEASRLDNEAAIFSGLNQQRLFNALDPLVEASELVQAARRHSLDMATNHFTDHTGSDGTLPWQRVSEACYDWVATGEIIGWGFGGNTDSMLNWWMNSPIHRDTILSSVYMDVGAGYIYQEDSQWGHYWTVNFGRRVSESGFSAEEQHICEYKTEGEFGGVALIFLSPDPCVN